MILSVFISTASKDSTHQKIHATKSDEPLPDWRPAPWFPERPNLLQAPTVKRSCAIEHDRSRAEEQNPGCSRSVARPEWFHDPHPAGVARRKQVHVDNADNEGRNNSKNCEDEAFENMSLLALLHAFSSVLKRGRVMNCCGERLPVR